MKNFIMPSSNETTYEQTSPYRVVAPIPGRNLVSRLLLKGNGLFTSAITAATVHDICSPAMTTNGP